MSAGVAPNMCCDWSVLGPCVEGKACQLQSAQCQTRKGPENSSQLAIYYTEGKMRTREGKNLPKATQQVGGEDL